MGPRTQVTERECRNRGRRWKRTALQKARFEKGLTLVEAAAEIHITPAYLNTLELGRCDPTLLLALRIAAFYGVSVIELWLEPAVK